MRWRRRNRAEDLEREGRIGFYHGLLEAIP
jgi:hypothetical protein